MDPLSGSWRVQGRSEIFRAAAAEGLRRGRSTSVPLALTHSWAHITTSFRHRLGCVGTDASCVEDDSSRNVPSSGSGPMRRVLVISFSTLVAVFLAGFAVAVARPQWVPARARIDPEKLPTWARFGGKAPSAEDAGLFCKEHGVPEKFCTLCHKELQDKLMLCKEHGNIPEDICTICHPGVAKRYNIEICKEHGLPKEFCFKCGKGP